MNREDRRALMKKGGVPGKMDKDAYIRRLEKENQRLAGLAREYYMKWKLQKGFDFQQAKDFLAITLHENFDFGPERNKRALDAFSQLSLEIWDLAIEDSGLRKKELTEREKALGMKPDYTAGDEKLTYTLTIMDRKVKEALGPYFEDYGTRYSDERLYNSERDLPSLASRR